MARRYGWSIGLLAGAFVLGASGCTGSDPLIPNNFQVNWVTEAQQQGSFTCATIGIQDIELRPTDPQASQALGPANIGFVTLATFPEGIVGFIPPSPPCGFRLPPVVLPPGRYEIVHFIVTDAVLRDATSFQQCFAFEPRDVAPSYPIEERTITVAEGQDMVRMVLNVPALVPAMNRSCDDLSGGGFYDNIRNILQFE
jgi:hypothetical protein